MLIAAASVGNQLAFAYFSDRISDLQQQGKFFRSVWSAAVLANRNDALEYRISKLAPFPVLGCTLTPIMSSQHARSEMILPIWEALCFACSHAKVTVGKMLMDILLKGDLLQDMEMRNYYDDLSSHCMQADCVSLLEYLIEHLSQVDKNELYPHLMESFVLKACRNGRLNVMRYLLERQYVSPNKKQLDVDGNFRDTDTDSEIDWEEDETYWDHIEEPLVAAAKGCHIEAMKLLLKHGAKPEPRELLREIHHNGITGYKHKTVSFLLGIEITLYDEAYIISDFVRRIDDRDLWQDRKVTTDEAMTLIELTSAFTRISGCRGPWDFINMTGMHRIVQGVLENGPELPRAPVDFVELAKECLKWYSQNGRNDVTWI